MPGVLLCCSVHQAHRGAPLAGVLLCRSVCQALKGAHWVGSYCVVQCLCHAFDGPASHVQLPMLRCGEREAMAMAPSPTCDSAVSPCFHGCLAFLHRHFPQQSPPSCPLNLSLHSQQQLPPWDYSAIPILQLPALVPCRGHVSLSAVCMAVARTV